jgi:hypothetical protein
MTSLWKMTQISKLKAGSFVDSEAGTGIPLNSESESRSGIPPPCQWTVAVGAGSSPSASGHWPGHGACAHTQAGSQGLSGTMGRDYGSGASSWIGPGRGQSLVPVPSQFTVVRTRHCVGNQLTRSPFKATLLLISGRLRGLAAADAMGDREHLTGCTLRQSCILHANVSLAAVSDQPSKARRRRRSAFGTWLVKMGWYPIVRAS